MKKKIFTTVCCSMMLSAASIALGAGGPYVSGNIGVTLPSDSDVTASAVPDISVESDNNLGLGIAAGYGFSNNTRLEAELAYQKNDLDKAEYSHTEVNLDGDTSSLALLLNGYYDFANKSPLTPFVSAGLGLARIDCNDLNVQGSGLPNTDDDDTVFAYQVGAGVGYAVSGKVSLDVKYRYFGTSDPEFGRTEAEYSSHNVYAGVRVSL